MKQAIVGITLLVRDYDEAVLFYCEKLGFTLLEDVALSENKRWVRVAPPGNAGSALLLARAATQEQIASIGNQTGGRVFLFLQTDAFWLTYYRMRERAVQFLEEPHHESYGWVVVFQDLYGNKWDLLE